QPRGRERELKRPFHAGPDVRLFGAKVPLPALVGAPLTFAIWILALATHSGARYAGTVWLAPGPAGFVAVGRARRQGLLEHVEPVEELPPGVDFRRILVP